MKNGYTWAAFGKLWVGSLCLLTSVLTFLPALANPPEPNQVFTMGTSSLGTRNARKVKAEQLVQFALQSEVEGQSARRNAQLERALQVAPDFAPAHWHSGKVRLGQKWIGVVEAQRQAAGDPRFTQYGQLCDQYADTLEGQIHLALWCRQQGLESQQRFHWENVLAQNPVYQQAQRSLGVHLVSGQLLTSAEIKQQRELRKKLHQLTEQLKPQIKRWLKKWKRHDPDERLAVLAQIENWAQIVPEDQPLTIPQIERDLSARHRQISLAIVTGLGRLVDHRATMSLMRHAVLSPFVEVRKAAIDQLASRPLHDFVPTLMGQLKSPVESSYSVVPLYDGSVSYTHELYEEGPEQNRSKTFFGNFRQDNTQRNYAVNIRLMSRTGEHEVRMRMLTRAEMRNIAREKQQRAIVHTRSYMTQAANLEKNLAQFNHLRKHNNERIMMVLAQVTDQYLEENPQTWWEWWRNYNELVPDEIPTYEQTYTDWQYDRSPRLYDSVTTYSSCFPQGTPVWTMTGQKPIESVRKGSWVLTQEPDTGQLAFKPVLETTFGDPQPLLELTVDGKTLRTTLGHLFWVNGKGWRMAKQLQAGDLLHTVWGSLAIDRVAKTDPEEACNLVVHDFGTYFVGAAGFLVHDITFRQPTRALVPGLAAQSVP